MPDRIAYKVMLATEMEQMQRDGLFRGSPADTADGYIHLSCAGPTIWLLHSLLADAGSCRPLAARLAPTHRVLLPDLPGFGASPPAGPGLDAVADRIAGAMRADGAPALLLGNGYGSFVALLVARRHPALVRKLILVGTGATFSEPGRQAFRAMAAAAAAQGLGAIADVAMRRLFAPEFQAANPGLLNERRARFLRTNPEMFAAACADLAALNLRPEVDKITVPTLILVGVVIRGFSLLRCSRALG